MEYILKTYIILSKKKKYWLADLTHIRGISEKIGPNYFSAPYKHLRFGETFDSFVIS